MAVKVTAQTVREDDSMFDGSGDDFAMAGGGPAAGPVSASVSPVSCTIDLDAPGRSIGHVVAPWSRNESGWGNLLTPIAVFAKGDGPTVLLTGGNHGDEFEGPVALRRLVRTLDVDDVSGRVIVVPGLNHAALCAGARLSPIDGCNMNRSFPGAPDGTMTERLADFVYQELVTRADVVLDLHSGGSSMVFEPFVAMHDLDDADRTATTLGYLDAFGTELAVIMSEPDRHGLLDSAVERSGKIFLTTEICGGRSISARSVDVAFRGVINTLRHAGVLASASASGGERRPRLVRMLDGTAAMAPQAGLFEPLVDTGQHVAAGSPLACIHPLDDLRANPIDVPAPLDGLVIMRHNAGLIAAGDPVAAMAVPVDREGSR